jgi:cell division FtsZ-interacting protein ZapD
MVGMLLESAGKRTVISSSARYSSQHNAFNWNVERTEFVRGNLADVAKLLDHILKTWLTEISLAERGAFLEAFFDLLGDSEETTISTDPLQNLKEIQKILKKYSQLDKETKSLMNQVFGSLSTQTKQTMSTTIKQILPGK